jgi:hypothetical protein
MPVAKLTCPKCKAVLKPSKPLPAGKPVKCPKCGHAFVTPDEEPKAIAVMPVEEAPAAPKRPYDDDEDDGPATYGVVDEPEPVRKKRDDYDDDDDDEDEDDEDEEEDERPDLSVVPDLTVKDPRGIAQEMLARPSNYMMLFAVLDFLVVLIWMGWVLIPVVFSLPEETNVDQGKGGAQVGKDTAKEAQQQLVLGLAKWIGVLITCVVGLIFLVYDGLIVVGAVKIQNQESWGWGLAGCILGIIPIFGACCLFYIGRLIASIFTLIALRNPIVVDAFNYKPE